MTSLLVLGGARSGKSHYAQSRVEAMDGPWTYIATAQAFDDEMADRIARHQSDRGEGWRTVEAPMDLCDAITAAAREGGPILVDCLTLWLSNIILADLDEDAAGDALCDAVAECPVPITLVANEVGLAIVPDNALARRFRDAAGRLNQKLARQMGEVVFIAAGLPLILKGR